MRSWLLRGLIFAFLMVVLRVVQGVMVNTWETRAQLISISLVVIYGLLVLIWGFIDGRRDANAQPDPDRRADLAMTWLLAGLVAGLLSGAVCWVISLFYKTIYVAALLNELTTFAAFTALLVFLLAMLGVAVGRFLVDRRYNKNGGRPRKREGADDDNPDTDVFAAVGGGQQRAASHEETTQQAPLHEGRTQEAQRPEHGQSN
jgi:MFS family permease